MNPTPSSQSISLDEFQRVSTLPDQAVLALLRERALPLELSANQELRVRIDLLDKSRIQSTLATLTSNFEEHWGAIIEERCAYILGQEFSTMLANLREGRTSLEGSTK